MSFAERNNHCIPKTIPNTKYTEMHDVIIQHVFGVLLFESTGFIKI